MLSRVCLFAASLLLSCLFIAQSPAAPPPLEPLTPALAEKIHQVLMEHNLRPWLPRSVDNERGGFHETWSETWQRVDDSEQRTLVFQSRLVWTCATVAETYPELREQYIGYLRHGIRHLKEVFVDRENGGLYFARLPDGSGTDFFMDEKHAYALSFAIYAAAAAHRVDPESGGLELAIDTFRWLDQHGYDSEHGGYLEAFLADGTPILSPEQSQRGKPFDPLGTFYGYKDQNTHLHLLESFTELYRVWPDPLLRKRLEELLLLMRDRIAVEPGCLNLFFTRDWRAVPDHDSFGHDVEAAYLMVEAAEVLGMGEDEKTWKMAKMLVDHALTYGWDKDNGGFFDKGSAFRHPHDKTKLWWVQAEGLNTLMLFHERFGRETPLYGQRFLEQWRFMHTYQLDHVNKGWYTTTSPDGIANPGQNKSGHWKEPYHAGRALMNVERRLRELPVELHLEPENPETTMINRSGLRIEVSRGANPWTHLDFKADQVAFQFAVVSDNAGNMRRGPFIRAVKTLNLLQPDFVMSVGDFINGYRPTAEEINAMWDEFLPWLKPLEPPFFFVVGNHDFGSPVMKPIWNERFGREYYHFTYKGALFLCMNAIDNNHRRGIGEEQVAYFRKVLEENPKPLWTFVFLHAPLWQEPNAPGWKEIEALLADRPHTVFAGHIHQYLKEIRNNGNEYYTLSVTGGGNLLRGPAYGDFDHVAWVSVKTNDKPLVANVDINHVHPSNVRTPANKSIAWSVDRAVHFPPVRIADENVTTIQAEIVIQNWTDNAGRISGTIKPHPSLTITPRSFDVTLEPKSRQAFPIELKAARPMNPLDIRPIEFEGVARYEVADDSPSVWPIKASLELDVVGKVIEAAAPVEVDGRLTEWGELPHDLSRPRVIGGNAMAFTGDSDVSAKFALSHDAENLYIAVAVSDDAVIVGENGDGVELWLDTRPDKERLSGVGVRREMFNNVLRMTILPGDGDAPARLLEADNMPANTRFAAVRTQQGYSVEIAIPVKYLNEKAKRDSGWQDLRFNACVKDVDAIGEQSAQIWWRPDWQGRSNLPGSGTFAR